MAINRIAPGGRAFVRFHRRRTVQVAHQLVAEEIKVDPGFVTAAFLAVEHGFVKLARLFQVVHGDGKVKGVHSLVSRYCLV